MGGWRCVWKIHCHNWWHNMYLYQSIREHPADRESYQKFIYWIHSDLGDWSRLWDQRIPGSLIGKLESQHQWKHKDKSLTPWYTVIWADISVLTSSLPLEGPWSYLQLSTSAQLFYVALLWTFVYDLVDQICTKGKDGREKISRTSSWTCSVLKMDRLKKIKVLKMTEVLETVEDEKKGAFLLDRRCLANMEPAVSIHE